MKRTPLLRLALLLVFGGAALLYLELALQLWRERPFVQNRDAAPAPAGVPVPEPHDEPQPKPRRPTARQRKDTE